MSIEGKVIGPSVELVSADVMDATAYPKQVELRIRAVKEAANALRSGRGLMKGKAGRIDDIVALSQYILTGAEPEWYEPKEIR
jgi:hypothetical protein